MKKPCLLIGVFHCCLLLLLGCGGSQEPEVPSSDRNPTADSESTDDTASGSSESETQTEISDDPPLTVANVPDRYSTKVVPTETNPWKGPRPEVPVSSLSEAKFLASWQIDLQVSDKPLVEVIQEITTPVPGWKPEIVLAKKVDTDAEALDPAVLQQPISLNLQKVSRLEAIEKACEAAGVYPRYGHDREFAGDTKPVITLHLGPRSRKFQAYDADPMSKVVCFAGPVMIELTKIQQFPPYGTGSLELRMNSLPLPTPVLSLLTGTPTNIQSVTVVNGEDVLTGRAGSSHVIVPTELDVRLETLHLKHLLKDVTRLEKISGQLSLPLPNSASVVWIDTLVEGTVAFNEDDEVTAKLETNSTSPGSWYLRYSVVSDRSLSGLAAFAYDASGKLIKTDGFGTSWAPNFNQGSGSLNLSQEPRMLAVVVVNKQTTYEQEFALTNIPLNKHQEQPEKLPELTFGDFPQPISVIVGELNRDNIFKQVDLRLVNHANKAIRELDVLLHYLDSAGETLRDNPTVISAKLSDAKQPYPILIPAEQTVEIKQTAFFCPDETRQVRVSIQSVTFADLDRWEAEK